MTQLEITEVLGAASGENLMLLLAVVSVIGLAMGVAWGAIVAICWLQDTFFQVKEAADEAAFYVQERILRPVYRTDGGRLWDKWSAPYKAQEQPAIQPLWLAEKCEFINQLEELGWSTSAIVTLIEENGWE